MPQAIVYMSDEENQIVEKIKKVLEVSKAEAIKWVIRNAEIPKTPPKTR